MKKVICVLFGLVLFFSGFAQEDTMLEDYFTSKDEGRCLKLLDTTDNQFITVYIHKNKLNMLRYNSFEGETWKESYNISKTEIKDVDNEFINLEITDKIIFKNGYLDLSVYPIELSLNNTKRYYQDLTFSTKEIKGTLNESLTSEKNRVACTQRNLIDTLSDENVIIVYNDNYVDIMLVSYSFGENELVYCKSFSVKDFEMKMDEYNDNELPYITLKGGWKIDFSKSYPQIIIGDQVRYLKFN